MAQKPRTEPNMPEEDINAMMLKGILLYLKIGVYPNCCQRGIIQQLMEADTYPQSDIRWNSENPVEKIVRVRGFQNTRNKPTETTNFGSQDLTEAETTTREPKWD